MTAIDESIQSKHLKDDIIFNVLEFIENNTDELKDKVLSDIVDFAKLKHVIVKRKTFKSVNMIYLKKFIRNREGYNISINNLYNSIINM